MKKIIRIHILLLLITCIGFIDEIKAQPNIEELFNQSRESVKVENYDEAIRHLTIIINANPNSYKAHMLRGVCYWAKKEIENLELQKDPAKAYRMEVEIYGKLKPGEVPPKSQSSLNAIADLTKAIQLNPNQYNPYNVRGNVYLLEKDLEPAINDFQKVTELKPDYQQEPSLKGLKNKLVKTRNDYANSLQMRAIDLGISIGYSKEYQAKATGEELKKSQIRTEENEKLYRTLLLKAVQTFAPNDFYTFHSRATSNESLENWNAALNDYTEALKFKPNDLSVINKRALIYVKIGNSQKAISDLSMVIAMQNVPENEKFYQNGAYLERGKIFAEQGKLNEAIADFDKLIALNPKSYITYLERGRIHAKKGNKVLARADFLKAGETPNLISISQFEIDVLDGKKKPKTEVSNPKKTNVSQSANNSTVNSNINPPSNRQRVVKVIDYVSAKYEGETYNGFPDGKGKYTDSDSIFEGEFKMNLRDGKGKETWISGSWKGCVYEGEWIKHNRTGFGKMTCPNGKFQEGYFENGVFKGKMPTQNVTNSLSNNSDLIWRKTNPTDIPNLKQIFGFNSTAGLHFLCRAEYAGGVYPGIVLQNKCNIGYQGKAIILENYEVYLPADNPNFELISKDGEKYAIGRESNGTPIYLCYLSYQNWWLPGRIVNGNCNYTWQGIEYYSTKFNYGYVATKNTAQTNNSTTKNNNNNSNNSSKQIDGTLGALEGESWLSKGDAADSAKNYAEALTWYRKASEKGYERASYNIGTYYYFGFGVEKNYTEAMIWFKIAADKGYGKAMFNIAVMYYNAQGVGKNNTEAVNWFRKAAQKGVQEAKDVLKKMNVSETENATPSQSSNKSPNQSSNNKSSNKEVVYNDLLMEAEEDENWQSVVTYATFLIEINPQWDYFMTRCGAYNELEKFDLAIKDCNEVLQIYPNYDTALFYRARAYDGSGKSDASINDLTKVIEISKNKLYIENSYYMRGHINERKGNRTAAINDYREALKLSPTSVDTKNALKRLGVQP